MSSNVFFFRSPKDMDALKAWLNDRHYNAACITSTDRKGNPMVGLVYDSDPDNDWKLPDKAGLIIVTHRQSAEKVEAQAKRQAKK